MLQLCKFKLSEQVDQIRRHFQVREEAERDESARFPTVPGHPISLCARASIMYEIGPKFAEMTSAEYAKRATTQERPAMVAEHEKNEEDRLVDCSCPGKLIN